MKNFFNKYLPLALSAILILATIGVWKIQTAYATGLTFDQIVLVPYVAGGTTTQSLTPVGSNICVVLYVWWDTGAPTSVTYGGTTMSLVITHSTQYFSANGQLSLYVLGGQTSATKTVSLTVTGQALTYVADWSNCSATQPDATAAYTTGIVNGSFELGLPVTTVANNAVETGIFQDQESAMNNGPSSNGTYTGSAFQFGIGGYIWYSTSAITPAGSFSLNGKSTGLGDNAEAIGFSLAPFTSGGSTPTPKASTTILQSGSLFIGKQGSYYINNAN